MEKLKKKNIIILILLIIAILMILVNSITVFSITSQSADYVYGMLENEWNLETVDICILDYDYVTGASWMVEKSTNKELENTYVYLNTIYNPRDLKINKEFDLDYSAKYVVVIDKNIDKTKVYDEEVTVLKIKEIVITGFCYHNDDFDDIKFSALTFTGKRKSIMAFFVPELRLQM